MNPKDRKRPTDPGPDLSPEAVAAHRVRLARLAEDHEAHLRAEAPLVAELRAAGLQVDTVWDLVNANRPYPAAIPILLRHLGREYPAVVREGIGRALSCEESRDSWSELAAAFELAAELNVKYAIAAALSTIATPENLGAIESWSRRTELATARAPFIEVLGRMGNRSSLDVLMEVASDPEVGGTARLAARRLRSRLARSP